MPGWYKGLVTDFRERSMADANKQWGHCIAYDIGTPDETFEWVYIPVRSSSNGAGCRSNTHAVGPVACSAVRWRCALARRPGVGADFGAGLL